MIFFFYFGGGGGGGGGLNFSQRDDGSSGLQDVFERIEEVVLAAQGLQEVTVVMKELSDVASSNRRTTGDDKLPSTTATGSIQLHKAAVSIYLFFFKFVIF